MLPVVLVLLSLWLGATPQTCHYSCVTCSGTLFTDCTSCIDGLYLSGTVCVASCDVLTAPQTKSCVYGCPAYYFQRGSVCELCPENCKYCSSAEVCDEWEDGYDPNNIILDLMPLWITTGVVFLALVSLLIWRLCLGKKTFSNSVEEEIIDHKPAPPAPSPPVPPPPA